MYLFYEYFHGLCSDELSWFRLWLHRFKWGTRLGDRSHHLNFQISHCNRQFFSNGFFFGISHLEHIFGFLLSYTIFKVLNATFILLEYCSFIDFFLSNVFSVSAIVIVSQWLLKVKWNRSLFYYGQNYFTLQNSWLESRQVNDFLMIDR